VLITFCVATFFFHNSLDPSFFPLFYHFIRSDPRHVLPFFSLEQTESFIFTAPGKSASQQVVVVVMTAKGSF
jgi:hypothetical protein